ncbi:MAG: TetR/AcrR family transcriptional regulator [Desulfovibrio sp.]|uniref:TetR/AcrR family transcriptional regulator n=1 Tax=Desulfovibrio sp. 7SRBS1 TaxID=3378064 RepID=UPI003B3D1FE4
MGLRNDTNQRLAALSKVDKARWLDPAEQEFRDLGFAKASLNRILASVKASKGQFYYYFANKEALYRAVVERALKQFVVKLDVHPPLVCASATEFWKETTEIIANVSSAFRANPRFAELARGIHREAAAEMAVPGLQKRLLNWLRKWLISGQQSGAVRDDLPLDLIAALAFSAMREADHWFAIHGNQLQPTEVRTINGVITQMLLAMLAPPDRLADLTARCPITS